LEIKEEALQWLDGQEGNIGIRLTSIGKLYQPRRSEKPEDFPASLISS